MRTRNEWNLRLSAAFVLLLFMITGATVYRETQRLLEVNHLLEQTHKVLVELSTLQTTLTDAQTSIRSYIASGDELSPDLFKNANSSVDESLRLIRSLTADNPVQKVRVEQLESQLALILQSWEEVVSKRRREGPAAANQLMTGQIVELMRQSRVIMRAMIQEENQLLGTGVQEGQSSAHRAVLIESALALAVLGLLVGTYVLIQMEIRREAEAFQQNSQLSTLGDLLQSCQTVEEACSLSANTLPRIFQSRPGALCITSPSRNIVETLTVWNNCSSTEQVFGPEDCWALRRGKVHLVSNPNSPVRCAHVSKSFTGDYVCVPLAAQGETLGVLYVENRNPRHDASRDVLNSSFNLERQATSVGERISLALANLKLRELLRNQSIRDALTGLFNRRYMEESLTRELHRAERKERNVSVVMLDLDHFKVFNDSFGHQAGDMLLREVAGVLKTRVRAGDIACRYGGEEFALILAETDVEGACLCAEHIRQEIRQLQLHYRGQPLGAATISVGVAVFPEHGESAEELVRLADGALYRAKADGRDRILVACPVLT